MGTKTRGISDKVYAYLVAHKNTEVHYSDIATELGLEAPQVMSSVHTLRNSTTRPQVIDAPRKGWYIYRGPAVKANDHKVVPHKAKAEVIGLIADDRLLVTVEGVVYVATPLDIG